ncbi:anoctamin-9-like [Paramormyrops kingsleyae]|uniref:Anoctamin n=1 Tax=Paramormyrops kingsleyae TaxID=1676925 RepID=A0A3B3SI79_9TELE|nr:anoctamin-9-like [Paramormyrops kingsleyae]
MFFKKQIQETSHEACGCGLPHGGTIGADPLLRPWREDDRYSQPQQACIELSGMPAENGSETPLLPPVRNPPSYDYVLVGKNIEDPNSEIRAKQKDFIAALKQKDIKVMEIVDEQKVFYGIRAPNEMFEKYRYLLKVSDACNWSCEQQREVILSTRIRIVHFILDHTYIKVNSEEENLDQLIKKNVFETKFCLHEKKKQKELTQIWARWSACFQRQPITEVRSYFGEKVALYYLWLGWYTYLLIPAAILGIVVFLYGLAFFNTSPLIKEVCEADIIMCPLCDRQCKVWNLSDTCTFAKVSILFDNEGTVAFAMFMAIWATVFLEFWKRHRATYVSKWKVYDWSEDEEELILEIINDPNCETKRYRHSYLHSTTVLILVTLMLMLIIGLAQALVVFRVMAQVQLSESSWEFLSDNANTVAVMLGAVLHYLTITIMTRVNRKVALKLCEIEETRSYAATERSFTVKMFTFQFFTLFSSLIYVAFFLGRINGRPGSYVRIAGKWRLEECHPSGCLTDLFIQMAIIMVLKQTLNNIFEFTGPWLRRYVKRRTTKKLQRKCGHCYKKECKETEEGSEICESCKLQSWLRNYRLTDVNAFSLFEEFLEMILQFSFTTIFVAAFPLAPFLALVNNVFEIRLDAIKMVSLERRLVPKKTNNIGIWSIILEAIGVLAVIANGLVIGVTSDFIPRLVYLYRYGPCANGNVTDISCMSGYINNSLSTVCVNDRNVINDFTPKQLITHNGLSVTHCSYKDYRNSEDYSFTSQFWLILAVRFAFVILFEHVVVICKFIVAWFVPDSPHKVKNDRLEDKLSRLKEELSLFKERRAQWQRSSDA